MQFNKSKNDIEKPVPARDAIKRLSLVESTEKTWDINDPKARKYD